MVEEMTRTSIRKRFLLFPATTSFDLERGGSNREAVHRLAEKKEYDRKKGIATMKDKLAKGKQELKFMNSSRNCWYSKTHLFLFCANLGNDVNIFPITMRLAMSISAGAFIIITFLSSILLVMPMVYSEIFLGRYSKLSNGQMYKMVPFAFGSTLVFFGLNILYFPVITARVAQYLTSVIKVLIASDIFIRCPRDTEDDSCYDYKIYGDLRHFNCSYDYMAFKCSDGNIYRYPVQYMYWKSMKDMDKDVQYPMWQFVISVIISWFVITTLSMLGMKVLGTVLKIFYFPYMMVCCVVLLMALTTNGGTNGLQLLVQVKFENIKFIEVIMILCFSFRKLGMVVPTGYMTYSAYTRFPRYGPSTEALIIVVTNLLQTIFMLGLFYSIAGVHAMNLGIPIDATIVPFEGMFMAMLPEFVVFKRCPNLFLVVYYTSSWTLELIKIAISKNWLVMNIYDYFPQVRNFESYVRVTTGCIFGILTLLAATEITSVVHIPLIHSSNAVVAIIFEMFLQSTLIFYCYGVNRLSDDIQFVSGKPPIRYWRVMWYLLPIICVAQLLMMVFNYEYNVIIDRDIMEKKLEFNVISVGSLMCVAITCLSLAISFLYIMFTFQKSSAAINVLKPQFLWGPPKTELRVARKLFAPRTAIRSQFNRKRKQRFRQHSIKQMREKDLAENVKRGRIFMDNMFFSDMTLGSRKIQVIIDDNMPRTKISESLHFG